MAVGVPGCEVIWVKLVSTPVSPCQYFSLSQYSIYMKFYDCVCECTWMCIGVQESIDVILGGTLGHISCTNLVISVSVCVGL